jgi:hypothetical protein
MFRLLKIIIVAILQHRLGEQHILINTALSPTSAPTMLGSPK